MSREGLAIINELCRQFHSNTATRRKIAREVKGQCRVMDELGVHYNLANVREMCALKTEVQVCNYTHDLKFA